MLSTAEFAEWSKQVVLFLHNTSRVDDEPYPNLLYEMGGIGFPTVSYLDAEGNLLKQVGHVTPVAQLAGAYEDLQAWRALRAEVERGDAGEAKEKQLFLLELEMGNRPYAEMQQRLDRLSFTKDELESMRQKLVNLQFTEILRKTPRDRQHEGGKQFLAMFRAGRIPNTSTETSFWQYMFAHAAHEKDVALFEDLLGKVKAAKEGDPRLSRYLRQLEEQLAALKAQPGGKDG